MPIASAAPKTLLVRLRKVGPDFRRFSASDAYKVRFVEWPHDSRRRRRSRLHVRLALVPVRTTGCRSFPRGCCRDRKTRRGRASRRYDRSKTISPARTATPESRRAVRARPPESPRARRSRRCPASPLLRSRRASTAVWASTSRGPISMRTGTPRKSHSLYFQPGCSSRASTRTRNPASLRRCARLVHASIARSSFERTIGTRIASIGAIFGGMRRPRSSPCTMIRAPSIRHDTPHEVV